MELFQQANKNDFEKIKSSLDYFDLFKIKDENVGNLSQGQRKKDITFQKLLLSKNLLWLLDEPFNGLDSDSIIKTKRFWKIIEKLEEKFWLFKPYRC